MRLRALHLIFLIILLTTIHLVARYYARPASMCEHPGWPVISKNQTLAQVQDLMGKPSSVDKEENLLLYSDESYSGTLRIQFSPDGLVTNKKCQPDQNYQARSH